MVVVPTDTIYGIAALPGGAHPDSTGADVVRRIYDAREREPEPALPFLLASRPDMGRLTRPNIAAIRLARRFWPGSLTLILPPSPDLPAALRAFPIAVRVPNFPALIPLLTAIGGYLLTTGAIRSGYSPAITASEANQLFGNDVALMRNEFAAAGGGDFEFAHSGMLGHALQLLDYESFAAIVLDLELPDSVGLDTLLQTIGRAPDIPIIIRTKAGDDSLALPMISVGACGVISVASNVIPKEMSALIRLALANDLAGARELHRVYYPLFRDLFIDTNPIPVKTALALMSRVGPTFRLPLCEPAESVRDQISRTLRSLNLL